MAMSKTTNLPETPDTQNISIAVLRDNEVGRTRIDGRNYYLIRGLLLQSEKTGRLYIAGAGERYILLTDSYQRADGKPSGYLHPIGEVNTVTGEEDAISG